MTQTYKSGNASVTTSGGSEDFVAQFLSSSRIRRLLGPMSAKAEAIVKEAIRGWPVERDSHGRPKPGPHSIDQFRVEERLTLNSVDVIVHNDAPHGYVIRSRMTNESEAQQVNRATWREGESEAQYKGRVTEGRRRNPWRGRVLKPGRRAIKELGPELAETLLELKGAD